MQLIKVQTNLPDHTLGFNWTARSRNWYLGIEADLMNKIWKKELLACYPSGYAA
jgi:hypothetical protein